MKLKNFDHMVITTRDLDACLHFYVDILGMEHVEQNGRHALKFGAQKFNIHTRKGEFQPAAQNVEYGSLDFCLIAEGDIYEIKDELVAKGCEIVEGVVERNGALGRMESVYVRDFDKNLIEISVYKAEAK
jgi:catechol 2,3-dioxygenase-like lactoylglutathione lyase family enzyme